MRKKGVIALCSSASFYKELLETEKVLQNMGFEIIVPIAARHMKQRGDFSVENYKTWFKNPEDYKIKSALVHEHFGEISKSDKVLVLNYEKNGLKGYIGGNVLMEMAVAFFLEKPIYILNDVSEKSNLYEEIMAMRPIFLNGKLNVL